MSDSAWRDAVGFFRPFIPQTSNIKNLKSLRVPVRILQAAFAAVLKELVHRSQQRDRAICAHADGEIEFVVEEIDVAVPKKAEKLSRHLKVVCMHDTVFHGQSSCGFARDAVAHVAGENGIQDSGKRSKH